MVIHAKTPLTHYLFVPKKELEAHLKSQHTEGIELLLENEIWNDLDDRGILWSEQGASGEQNELILAKYLFLSELCHHYLVGLDEPTKFSSLVAELVEYPHISVEVFDRWWDLHVFRDIDNTATCAVRAIVNNSVLDSLSKPVNQLGEEVLLPKA